VRVFTRDVSRLASTAGLCANIGRMLQLVAIGIATATAGGCSTGIPLPSLMAKTSSTEDVTGSIRGTSPLSNSLDQEDWRRARGALGLALDPQGNGSAVTWENPQSKAKGSFTPVGQAKAVDDKICRAFIAELAGSLKNETLQGDACRDRSGEWSVGKVQPFRRA